MATPLPVTADQATHLGDVSTAAIAPNPLNPRKRFPKEHLDGLADSIRAHGVLEPVIVRTNAAAKGRKGAPKYELVIGECRLRASNLAKRNRIPALLLEVDDAACREIMLVENGRRADLDPIDEAETYRELRDEHGLSLEDLARRVGKPKTTVFERLALTQAGPEVRKALEDGRIDVSVAELLARRVHGEHQKAALQEVEEKDFRPALSYRQAKKEIDASFVFLLKTAPWDLGDAVLVPKAGPCAECPKRTDAEVQAELFPGERTPAKATCLDRACYETKLAAHRDRLLERRRQKGEKVLTEKKAVAKVVSEWGDPKRGWKRLDWPFAGQYSGGKTLRSLLGKKDLPITVALIADRWDPQKEPTLVELVRERDAIAAAKKKNVKLVDRRRSTSSMTATDNRRRREARFRGRVHDLAVGAIVEDAAQVQELLPIGDPGEETRPQVAIDLPTLRIIAEDAVDSAWSDASKAALERRSLGGPKTGRREPSNALRKIARDGDAGEVLGVLFEIIAQRHRPRAWEPNTKSLATALFAARGVHAAAIMKRAKAYLGRLEKKKAASKKKKTAKKKTARRKAPARKKAARKKASKKTSRRR